MKIVEKYLEELTKAHKAYYAQNYPSLDAPTFSATYGKKYIKVIIFSGQKSVHCFLDFDGNIYKAASYKIPAKGIRGNVNNKTYPLMCGDYYR